MHAVLRETCYEPGKPIHEASQFQEFQQHHSMLNGYQGTIVVDTGAGRFLTLTLWRTARDMAAARVAMGPVVERTLRRVMTSPAKLLGTGPVVVNDLTQVANPPN